MEHNAVSSKLDRHRLLDIDDLSILTLIGEGVMFKDISRFLCLTPPAVTHRLNKYEGVWGKDIFNRNTKGRVLSETGKVVCDRAKKSLYYLLDFPKDFVYSSVFRGKDI